MFDYDIMHSTSKSGDGCPGLINKFTGVIDANFSDGTPDELNAML